MNYKKKRLWNRVISFALVLTLLFSDQTLLQVSASTVSGGNAVVTEHVTQEPLSVSDSDLPEAGDSLSGAADVPEETTEYIPEMLTVSGNIPVREPEQFYSL